MTTCPGCARELPDGDFPFCPWCTHPLRDASSSGQRKTVSVLFADLVDSTALGSSVDPEVLRGLLGQYWQSARAVVEAHGGTVEKFIGDAVFGVFGIPTVHEDDALRAVRAAHDLLDEVAALNEVAAQRVGAALQVRVGVATGEVLSGDGLSTLMSGDAGNLAARLQSTAQPGTVLVSDETYRLVREHVDAQPLEPFLVKGKSEALTAYELVSVTPADRMPRRRRRYSGPMLARDRQLAMAENLYETVVEGSTCGLLSVIGEPGVGKSRLVDELLERVVPGAEVLIGRCLPYGVGITLAPIADMVAGLRERAVGTWQELLGDDPFTERVIEGLNALADGSTSTSVADLAWAFRRLLEAMGRRGPVMVVVDDLQWAEVGLLELLDDLSVRLRSAPVLLAVMARPELSVEERWSPRGPNTCTITLQPLPADVCRDLVGQMLGADIGDDLTSQLAAAAGGIPLFIEETVAMMVDDGLLVADDQRGGWRMAVEDAQVPIPGTVRALLSARLDLLAADERSVLEAASVIGKTFYLEAVARLVGEGVDVGTCLDGLLRSDLVGPASTDLAGYEAYAFNHLLMQDAAYQAQPKRHRAERHIAVARWLQEAGSGQGVDAIATTHLERALVYQQELGTVDGALLDDVVASLVSLSRGQLVIGDARAARRYADRAVLLSDGRRVEPLLVQSHAARMTGDEDAMALAARAVQVAETVGDQALYWRARLRLEGLRMFAAGGYQLDHAFDLAEQALAAVADDHATRAEAYRLRATALKIDDRFRQAAADARLAAHEAVLGPDSPGRFEELVTIVSLIGENGDATLTEAARALDELEEWLGFDLGVRNDLRDVRLWVRSWSGDVEGALAAMLDRVEMLLDQGASIWASSWLTSGIAWCHRWSGDAAEEEAVLRRGIALRQDSGDPAVLSALYAELALLLGRQGRVDEAGDLLRLSRDLSTLDDDRWNLTYWSLIEGCLAARAGRREESEGHFAEAIERVGATEMLEQTAIAWLACSNGREVQGDLDGALDAARHALRLMERKEFPVPITLIQRRVDDLTARLTPAS